MNLHATPQQENPASDPREQREAEILDRIRTTFAERGFDGASMQVLARAAGMSVGNFYRYFPSKADMVAAIIRRDLADVEQKFAEIRVAADPAEALRRGLHARIAEEDAACSLDEATLWAEINAAAARKPEIAQVVQKMEYEICTYLTRAFAQVNGMTPEEAEHRFGAHAMMAIMLVKAVALQGKGRETPHREELIALVQRMIDAVLDEVCAAKSGD